LGEVTGLFLIVVFEQDAGGFFGIFTLGFLFILLLLLFSVLDFSQDLQAIQILL
jgi:hypothetical protein|tara:strand:+ start:477 stop:638 length:162 start_codon:yes stop_codon:yes gene_type:complete